MKTKICAQLCAAMTLALAAVGCQTWQRRPLDLAGVVERWEATTAAAAAAAASASPNAMKLDVADGITAAEAWLIAAHLNPDLRVARAVARVAMAAQVAAGRWPDPQLSGAARRVSDAVPSAWQTEFSLGFVIPLSTRRIAASALADANADAAGWTLQQRLLDVRIELLRVWSQWSASAAKLAVFNAHVSTVGPLLEAASRAADAGELSPSLAGVAQMSALMLRQTQLRIARDTELARRAVLRTMGLRPDAPATLSPGIALPTPPAEAASDADRIRRNHPQVLAAIARYEASEQTLRREVAKQIPDLVIGPNYQAFAGQSAVGLGLGLPIAVLNGNRQAIEIARARRAVQRRRVEAAMRALLTQANDCRARIRLVQVQVEDLKAHVLPASAALLRRLVALQSAGELQTLTVIQALDRMLAIKLAAIDTELALTLAHVDHLGAVPPPVRAKTPPAVPASPSKVQP